jgi:hypothetical protein
VLSALGTLEGSVDDGWVYVVGPFFGMLGLGCMGWSAVYGGIEVKASGLCHPALSATLVRAHRSPRAGTDEGSAQLSAVCAATRQRSAQ